MARRHRARATKDIDVVLQHVDADLARTLEGAMSGEAYQGFTFRRKGEPLLLDNGAVNLKLAVSYLSSAWTTIAVDIARAEPGEAEIEWLPAIPLTNAFGITGPVDLPCLPLRFHIAQKLHGMTLPPRARRRNERFRDLIDLLLIEELVTDYTRLRKACEMVFGSRGTHVWPPPLAVPPYWLEPFARLAADRSGTAIWSDHAAGLCVPDLYLHPPRPVIDQPPQGFLRARPRSRRPLTNRGG